MARISNGTAIIFSLSANRVGGEGRGEVARETKFVFYVRPHLCPLPRGEDFGNHAPDNSFGCPGRPGVHCLRGSRITVIPSSRDVRLLLVLGVAGRSGAVSFS